jgi:hypothetical protein
MTEKEIFYCMNCGKQFYLSEEETETMQGLRTHLLEADKLAANLGFNRFDIPTTIKLYQNKAKCCSKPGITNRLAGQTILRNP